MSERSKALERPRFFSRQMITADDLSGGIDYLRARMRRHNRALHGWGIVYGVAVAFKPDDDGTVRKLTITPGLVLSPQGDEIEVLTNQVYDTTRQPTPTTDSGGNDPYMSNVVIDQRDTGVKYLAIRYNEVPTRMIRVAPSACDCGGTSACENSRVQDAYTIELLDTLPPTYDPAVTTDPLAKVLSDVVAAKPEDKANLLLKGLFGEGLPVAPTVPTSPWVVLADVLLDGGVIKGVDMKHRRMVVSLAPLWWTPKSTLALDKSPTATSVLDPGDPTKSKMLLTVKITGSGLATVTEKSIKFLNDGGKIQDVTVKDVTDTSLTILASYPVSAADAVKAVFLLIVRPDGLSTFSDKIDIVTPPGAAPAAPASGGP
jgi:hypothetical protein